MSWLLKKDGATLAISGAWNPTLFADKCKTSFPAAVPNGWSWVQDGFALAWADDPPPTAEQIAAQVAAAELEAADESALVVAKADATVKYLVNHTPQECYDKVMADVTNLATAKEVLARLAMAVSAGLRDRLR